MNIRRTPDSLFITWRMWLVIFATAFGIYAGGVTSGYMYANALHNSIQGNALTQVDRKIDQLPERTAEAVKEDVRK